MSTADEIRVRVQVMRDLYDLYPETRGVRIQVWWDGYSAYFDPTGRHHGMIANPASHPGCSSGIEVPDAVDGYEQPDIGRICEHPEVAAEIERIGSVPPNECVSSLASVYSRMHARTEGKQLTPPVYNPINGPEWLRPGIPVRGAQIDWLGGRNELTGIAIEETSPGTWKLKPFGYGSNITTSMKRGEIFCPDARNYTGLSILEWIVDVLQVPGIEVFGDLTAIDDLGNPIAPHEQLAIVADWLEEGGHPFPARVLRWWLAIRQHAGEDLGQTVRVVRGLIDGSIPSVFSIPAEG